MGTSSRERLVEAMSELMWERGYAATSPGEVRKRSGVGQGSMYHHFPSKRDLALAALERNCADILPSAEELLTAPGDPLTRIEGYLNGPRTPLRGCKVGRMTQDPVVAADSGLLAPVAETFQRIHSALAHVLDEAVAAGQLRADLDPDRMANLVVAAIQGGFVLAIAEQDTPPFEQACAGVMDLLRAASPAPPPSLDPAPRLAE